MCPDETPAAAAAGVRVCPCGTEAYWRASTAVRISWSSGKRPSAFLLKTSSPSMVTSKTPPPEATSSATTPWARLIAAARPAARGS